MREALLLLKVSNTRSALAIQYAVIPPTTIAVRHYQRAGRSSLMAELSTMPIPPTSAKRQSESSGDVQWQVAIIGQPLQTANQACAS